MPSASVDPASRAAQVLERQHGDGTRAWPVPADRAPAASSRSCDSINVHSTPATANAASTNQSRRERQPRLGTSSVGDGPLEPLSGVPPRAQPPRRTAVVGRCRGSQRFGVRNETITATAHACDITWMGRVVSQRVAQQLDALADRLRTHDHTAPDALHQVVQGQQARRRFGECDEQVERQLRQRDLPAVPGQSHLADVELEVRDPVD